MYNVLYCANANYLVVDYSSEKCDVDLNRGDRIIAVGQPPLMLSSSAAAAVAAGSLRQGPCGTDASPWSIRVGPGQRINVTLIDFTAAATSTTTQHDFSLHGPGNKVHNFTC